MFSTDGFQAHVLTHGFLIALPDRFCHSHSTEKQLRNQQVKVMVVHVCYPSDWGQRLENGEFVANLSCSTTLGGEVEKGQEKGEEEENDKKRRKKRGGEGEEGDMKRKKIRRRKGGGGREGGGRKKEKQGVK